MPELYKMISFAVKHGDCGGSLVQFQEGDATGNALPFEIGKVLVISDINTDDIRGNHAHYETEEILVALTGGCTVEMDDGRGRWESVRLGGGRGVVDCGKLDVEAGMCPTADNRQLATSNHEETKALLLFPHVWRTMRDFEPGTLLMVVANIQYDESDYIRDRSEFEQAAEAWSGLGGSIEV